MAQYEAKNARILGVSFDSIEENRRFAEKLQLPFPLLCDTDHTIGVAYGAADSTADEYPRRIAYVIDEQGVIAQAHAKVDAASYPASQLQSL